MMITILSNIIKKNVTRAKCRNALNAKKFSFEDELPPSLDWLLECVHSNVIFKEVSLRNNEILNAILWIFP